MDEKFQLMKAVLIGSTGFIGSHIAEELEGRNISYAGLSSKYIDLVSNETRNRIERQSNMCLDQIADHLSEDTVVINAAWGPNLRSNRDSRLHRNNAENEIDLIKFVMKFKCKYVSLGSISEINHELIGQSNDTQYSKAKQEISNFLDSNYDNYLWLRIASAYGYRDSRDWLVTQLIKDGPQFKVKTPDALLNLTDVNSISRSVINQGFEDKVGVLNFWSEQWMTVANIRDCYQYLSAPIYEEPTFEYFALADKQGFKLESENILDFFKDRRAQSNIV